MTGVAKERDYVKKGPSGTYSNSVSANQLSIDLSHCIGELTQYAEDEDDMEGYDLEEWWEYECNKDRETVGMAAKGERSI